MDNVFVAVNAAAQGDIKLIKELIADGASPKQGDYDLRCPLHLAASEGHLEMVKYLVEEAKVDVNPHDRWGSTPLQDALRYKFYDVAQYLRNHGAILPASASTVLGELVQAASDGLDQKVKTLIQGGNDVNGTDFDGKTALHHASSQGKHDMVELLLKSGALVNATDRFGRTPLHEAVQGHHDKIAEYLRQNGARSADPKRFLATPQFISTLKKVINMICQKNQFPYGTAWVLDTDRGAAKVTMNWFADTDAIAKVSAFRQSVEASFLPLTEDNVITSAFNKKTHQWIEDVSADNNREAGCLRADCVSAGFKSVITVPVLFEGAALAVLEFRTFEARSENLDVVSSASSVATRSISAAMESDLSESISTTTSTRSTYTDQMNSVYRLIMQEGQFAEAVVAREIEWFYSRLCFNDFYFQHYPPDVIARHVLAFIAAKVHAQATGQEADVEFTSAEKDHAIYICPAERAVAIQRKIEEKYIGEGFLGSPGIVAKGQGLSAKMFLSAGTAGPNSSVRLTLHVVGAQSYVNPESSSNETDIWKVASGVFLREKSFSSRDRYAKILKRAVASLGPVFDASASTTPGEDAVLTCAYRAGSTHSFYSSLSLLLTQRKVTITRGYVETFANGINCISLHLKDVKLEAMPDIVESASLLWILPRTTLSDLFVQGKLTLQESVYAYAAWKFAFHFTSAKTEEFNTLYAALKDNPVASANLLRLKKRIRSDVTTEARCAETIMENVDLIKELYQNFKKHHQPAAAGQPQPEKPTFCNELWNKISKNVMSNVDQAVLRTILVFNSCILRTNFFYSSKTALSFRIDPSFLADDVPQVPFAMFLLIGAEFRGFHIRFDDVARGGIRLIRSRNKQIWQRNAETVFDENYNLAWTQQKKNKDIPEGGSKGTVLVNVDHQNRAIIAFHKYIDSLLDCILVKPGEMVDHYGKQELIFCGPDEGTADLMDWAALHAKSRGYASWAAFTTGKSVELGGIPHDTYGMTTRGVHQYVLGIMRKLNIQEDTVTKFQTGGPDGDLGSNEIKISKDNTIGIVDGSGVLYDPKGLNRTELRRLANARKMSEHFDRKLLSPEGFFVHIDDKDITLPNGTLVESGMNFRNGFHTNPLAKAEFFVPCGGRPEAINISNVNQLFVDGVPIFKHIVEGANLFLTQDARLRLEEAGVTVFRDSSANKGGVTSSSLEVLTALTLNQEEFKEHMCVKDGVIPEFYKQYVVDVQNKIAENAEVEFECIWRDSQQTHVSKSILSDKLSERINELNHEIRGSGLFNNQNLRKKVLLAVLPPTLLKFLGLETIQARLPETYIVSLLSAYLASRYVYEAGVTPNEFKFYQFMQKFM